jgi:N-acetylneuraminic acid mutarotase
MKQARAGLGIVSVDCKIYAIGGYTTEYRDIERVGFNECYDPATNKWTTLKSMNFPRSNFVIAEYQSKIYCIGGFNDNGGCSTNEVYDVATDSWSTKASIPRSWSLKDSITSGYESSLQAYVIDGKIFVINVKSTDVWKPIKDGRLQTIKTTVYLYIYDPNTDVWIEKSSTPTLFNGDPIYHDGKKYFSDKPFDLLLSAIADDKIILMGIFHKHSISAAEKIIIVYNPANDTWAKKKSIPPFDFSDTYNSNYIVGVTSGVYAPQKVYIFSQASIYAHGNYVYDPIGDTWSTVKQAPVLLNSCGVAVVDDVLYIIGQGAVETDFIPHIGFKYDYFSTTLQYVPFDYQGTLPSVGFSLNNLAVIVILDLMVSVVIGLFFYFKKSRVKEI